MERSIIIDTGVTYTRAAILEDDQLVNILLENHQEKQEEGRIYQGRIANIVKSIKAAFVDIGGDEMAFLHLKDIPEQPRSKLQNNQRIAIQIIKEGSGNKKPKATAYLNISGRFMVLLPFEKTVGISKKILDQEQSKRLKDIIARNNLKGYGIIVRTEAAKASDEQLIWEFEQLIEKWEKINQMSLGAASGTILYEEPPLVMKVIREYANEKTKEIVMNDQKQGQLILNSLSKSLKNLGDKVRFVSHLNNLYGAYNIDREIENALKRKVWLKCGGNIIVEKTQAMNVIDVNSAKAVTGKQKDKMILKINLQAAKECARQIRLRNLSGIILIDFIDMDNRSNQEQVIETLELELKKDKIKTRVYPMTALGLVQITRQRKNNSLEEQIMQKCDCCSSPGMNMTYDYLLVGIEKEIRDIVRESIHREIVITARADLIKYIKSFSTIQSALQVKYNIKLQLLVNDTSKRLTYYVKPLYSNKQFDI